MWPQALLRLVFAGYSFRVNCPPPGPEGRLHAGREPSGLSTPHPLARDQSPALGGRSQPIRRREGVGGRRLILPLATVASPEGLLMSEAGAPAGAHPGGRAVPSEPRGFPLSVDYFPMFRTATKFPGPTQNETGAPPSLLRILRQ